jgi:hypothetical protein
MTITAADRRKIRVAKVIQQRMNKQGSDRSTDSETDCSDGGGRFGSCKTKKGMCSQDIKRERKIRNRESAIRYRQRKQSELDLLNQRILELQTENHYLKSRLGQYEQPSTHSFCYTTMEPAII